MARKLSPDKIGVELDVNATKAQEEIYKLTKSTEALRKQNAQYRKDISALAATEGDHSQEIARLNEQISANTEQIRQNQREVSKWEKQIDTSYKTAAQLKKHLKDLRKELANTSRNLDPKRYKELEAEIRKTEKAYQEATKSSKGFLSSIFNMQKAVEALKGFFMGLGMALATQVIGQFSRLKDIIIDFERANSKLASVLGTTIEGVSRLTEQAKLLGRTTTATASEVTALQTELAKLGFSQEVIEKMTPATLKFAKAVDTDLSSAAAFAGAALRMFNKDASQAEELMATFAVSTTRSALDFRKLEASLATVGPVAHSFGLSVEETTALLGVLANAGFDASSAATATRNIILNLCDANGELAQALGEPVTNLDGLVAGLKKLNDEGVNLAKVLELTDKRSVAAFSTFLKNTDDLASLRDEITGATDDFNKMSETMGDNAYGAAKGFESAVEGLILKFFDFREVLKSMFETGTAVVQWLGELIDTLTSTGEVFKVLLAPVGLLVSQLGALVAWIAKLTTQTKLGRAALNGVVSALIAYKVAQIAASKATVTFVKDIATEIKRLTLKTVALYRVAGASGIATAAQRAWNAAIMANPIMLVIGLIAMAVSAIVGYNSTIDESTKKTDAWASANREASKLYGEQKGKIQALIMVAENENLSLSRRNKAVKELNKIIPGYNAKIDETTGKYKASKEMLDKYLDSLEKEMRYKANSEKFQTLMADAEAARDAYDEAVIAAEQAPKYLSKWYGKVYNAAPKRAVKEAKAAWDEAEEKAKAFKERMNKAMNEGLIVAPDNSTAENTVDKVLDKTNDKAAETVSRLKEINAELKRLRKMDPQSDEEMDRIQKRIELLQKERRELMGKGKTKREPGTYGADSLAEATAPVDDAHQQRLLKINTSDLAETEKVIARNRELIQYCGELTAALDDLRNHTDSTHTKTLDAINAEQNKLAQQSADAQLAINKAMAQQDATDHKNRIAATEAFYKQQNDLIRASVMADAALEDAARVYLLDMERQFHNDQLKELQQYYDKVAEADYYSKEEKQNLLRQIGADIQKTQSQILTDTGKFSEMLREAMTDTTSAEGIAASFARQREAMSAHYESLKSSAGVSSEEAVALETEKQRRIAALNYQYLEEQYKMQETAGLTWGDEYNRELEKLKHMHQQGILSEEQFQKARLALQVNNVKKYFDYYSQMAGSMVSAIQEAEIAQSEAKYDVLIQQAKNNGEDTAELEQEKENKKLEIQKKYADVDFAIKISQIIANTAVSIMQAFSQLGPIGGAIAAVMLTATGAAQVVTAKAERDKIKNMQPGSTGGGSQSAPTATRVLSGYSEGGYTGDGGRYEVAGVVHCGEYVVPMPIMEDPRVVDAVGTIEAIRQNKRLATGHTPSYAEGYADGGPVTGPSSPTTSDLTEAVSDLRAATEALRSIRAYVVYKDIEKAGQKLDAARAPFTRKK